mgnify:CR=1 FL=1
MHPPFAFAIEDSLLPFYIVGCFSKKKHEIFQLFSENSWKIGHFSQLENTTIFENSWIFENQKTPIFQLFFEKMADFPTIFGGFRV